MKILVRLYLVLFVFNYQIIFAQVPNGDFENWQGVYAKDWIASMQGAVVPSDAVRTELPSDDAFSGDSAMMIHNRLKPILGTQSFTVWPGYVEQKNVAIFERPICLSGAFKILYNVQDTLFVNLILKKSGNIIGVAQYTATGEVSTYSVFCVTPTYTTSDVPDSYDLRIGFNQFRQHANDSKDTYLLIDAVDLLHPTALSEISEQLPLKLFVDFTKQEFELSATNVNSQKFDIRLLSLDGVLIFSKSAIELPYKFSTEILNNGIYFLQAVSNDGIAQTLKVIK